MSPFPVRTVVDLSHNLENDMQIYPGDPVFSARSHATVEKDGFALTHISMGSHTGTHVDAPSHFIANGMTIDQVPLSAFMGPALVIDATAKRPREKIVWADIAPYADQLIPGVVVLLRTGWPKFWGTPEYLNHPYLDREAAEHIIASGVRALGTDALNPDETVIDGANEGNFGVHYTVLGAGGIIIENLMNLELVEEGMIVQFVPLKFSASDGSPVRAFAWRPGTP